MSVTELQNFMIDNPGVEALDAIMVDLNGLVRGKRLPRDQMDKPFRGEMYLPGSIYLLDSLGNSLNPYGLGVTDGDPDYKCHAIPGTLSIVPWNDWPLAQVLLTMRRDDGTPYPFDPRNVLALVVDRFKEMKWQPIVAFELEFYLLDRKAALDARAMPPISPVTGKRESQTQVYSMADLDNYSDFVEDVKEACQIQKIPLGAATSEYAPGQFEINFEHVNDPLAAADHAALFRRLVKQVARKHGFAATFMAKPYPDQAGNGMHVHVSMDDEQGKNIFNEERPDGPARLHNAIGGLVKTMPEAMAFFAPNVNSFRRFSPDSYAPMTPDWGHNNRNASVRIPPGDGPARRIEHRVAGADANPYLVLAAILAGMHDGLINQVEPGKPLDEKRNPSRELPRHWFDALARLEKGGVMMDYLGKEYCEVYAEGRRIEAERRLSQVTPLEMAWYLQID